jgi:hypothetical protein
MASGRHVVDLADVLELAVDEAAQEEIGKSCPDCAEALKAAAKACQCCGYRAALELTPSQLSARPTR